MSLADTCSCCRYKATANPMLHSAYFFSSLSREQTGQHEPCYTAALIKLTSANRESNFPLQNCECIGFLELSEQGPSVPQIPLSLP